MTIRYNESERPIDGLKAALFKCDTCGQSALYHTGGSSLESAKLVADVHEGALKALDHSPHDIVIYQFKIGDEFPEALVDENTQYYRDL